LQQSREAQRLAAANLHSLHIIAQKLRWPDHRNAGSTVATHADAEAFVAEARAWWRLWADEVMPWRHKHPQIQVFETAAEARMDRISSRRLWRREMISSNGQIRSATGPSPSPIL